MSSSPSLLADQSKKRKERREDRREREVEDVSLKGLKSETKLEASEPRFQVLSWRYFSIHNYILNFKKKKKTEEKRSKNFLLAF